MIAQTYMEETNNKKHIFSNSFVGHARPPFDKLRVVSGSAWLTILRNSKDKAEPKSCLTKRVVK